MAFVLKAEPIDTDSEQSFFSNNSSNDAPARRSSTSNDVTRGMTSQPLNLTSHPVNFLTEQDRPRMVLDPVQDDVLFLPPRAGGRGQGGRSRGGREVTEYATYTITHHEAELNSKLLPKKYRCRFCVYKTSYKSDLNRHLRKHGIAPQHCPLCNMPFKTTGNLENHMMQAHGDPTSVSSMRAQPSVCSEREFKNAEHHLMPDHGDSSAITSIGILNAAQHRLSTEEGFRAAENHALRSQSEMINPAGILPSPAIYIEGGFLNPLVLGTGSESGIRPFASPSSESVDQSSHHRHHQHHRRLHPQLQQDFPALSQAVLSPALLSCHVCNFICSDSEVLARHLLTHPAEEEASRALMSSDKSAVSGVNDRQSLRSPSPEMSVTRLGCNYCGIIVSSIDELQVHRRSCFDPQDSQRAGDCGHGSCSSPRCGDGGREFPTKNPTAKALETTKTGLPSQETMDKLKRTITGVPKSNDSSDCPSPPKRPPSGTNKPKRMTLPHIPVVELSDSEPKMQKSLRSESQPDRQDSSLSSIVQLVLRPDDSPEPMLITENDKYETPEEKEHCKERDSAAPNSTSSVLPSVSETVSYTAELEQEKGQGGRSFGNHCEKISEKAVPPKHTSSLPKSTTHHNTEIPSGDAPKRPQKAWKNLNKVRTPPTSRSAPEESVSNSIPQDEQPFQQEYIRIKEEPNSPETSVEFESFGPNETVENAPTSRIGDQIGPVFPGGQSGDERFERCTLCQDQFRRRAHLVTHLHLVHGLTQGLHSSSLRKLQTAAKLMPHDDVCMSRSRDDIHASSSRHNKSLGSNAHRVGRTERECTKRRGERTFWSRPSTAVPVQSNTSLRIPAQTTPRTTKSAAAPPDSRNAASDNLQNVHTSREDRQEERPHSQSSNTRFSTTRVTPQPPPSGRYAKLVSDFEEFSMKPYACSLCFFRTARLGELRLHVQNHLTGGSASPVPDTACFGPAEPFHTDQSTSPMEMDSLQMDSSHGQLCTYELTAQLRSYEGTSPTFTMNSSLNESLMAECGSPPQRIAHVARESPEIQIHMKHKNPRERTISSDASSAGWVSPACLVISDVQAGTQEDICSAKSFALDAPFPTTTSKTLKDGRGWKSPNTQGAMHFQFQGDGFGHEDCSASEGEDSGELKKNETQSLVSELKERGLASKLKESALVSESNEKSRVSESTSLVASTECQLHVDDPVTSSSAPDDPREGITPEDDEDTAMIICLNGDDDGDDFDNSDVTGEVLERIDIAYDDENDVNSQQSDFAEEVQTKTDTDDDDFSENCVTNLNNDASGEVHPMVDIAVDEVDDNDDGVINHDSGVSCEVHTGVAIVEDDAGDNSRILESEVDGEIHIRTDTATSNADDVRDGHHDNDVSENVLATAETADDDLGYDIDDHKRDQHTEKKQPSPPSFVTDVTPSADEVLTTALKDPCQNSYFCSTNVLPNTSTSLDVLNVLLSNEQSSADLLHQKDKTSSKPLNTVAVERRLDGEHLSGLSPDDQPNTSASRELLDAVLPGEHFSAETKDLLHQKDKTSTRSQDNTATDERRLDAELVSTATDERKLNGKLLPNSDQCADSPRRRELDLPKKPRARKGRTSSNSLKTRQRPALNANVRKNQKPKRVKDNKVAIFEKRPQRNKKFWWSSRGISRPSAGNAGGHRANRCGECGKTFSLKPLLVRHLRFRHTSGAQ